MSDRGGFLMPGSVMKVNTVMNTRITAAPTVQPISRRVLPWIWAATAPLRARNLIIAQSSAPATAMKMISARTKISTYSVWILSAFGEPPVSGKNMPACAAGAAAARATRTADSVTAARRGNDSLRMRRRSIWTRGAGSRVMARAPRGAVDQLTAGARRGFAGDRFGQVPRPSADPGARGGERGLGVGSQLGQEVAALGGGGHRRLHELGQVRGPERLDALAGALDGSGRPLLRARRLGGPAAVGRAVPLGDQILDRPP